MAYEFKVEDAYNFFNTNAIDIRRHGSELEAKYCPYCQGGSGRDQYTFSLNIEKGVFNCLRASCGKQGHFVELCRDFDFELDFGRPKIYKVLKQPTERINTTESAVAYLESRGIGKDIASRYEITSTIANPDVLVFPFFDDQGKLQFIKYRNTKYRKGVGNKEWCEKDTMPILFGMKQCVDFDTLIITEGQLDSLSVAQAGYKNACSVPTGANGFTWLVPCVDWVNKFKQLIVFGDWERGKMSLLDTLKNRVDIPVKAVRRQDYLGEKDANDILRKYGVSAIRKCIDKAEIPKLDNVKSLATVETVDLSELPKINTQIDELDRCIGGLVMGQVVLLTGKRGEGKSTLMSQLVANALDQNASVFAYSGELADFHFKRWLDTQLAGKEYMDPYETSFGDTVYKIKEEVIPRLNKWYDNRAFIFDNNYLPDTDDELGGLVQTIIRVIKTYDTRLICIDNLMTAMDVVDQQNNLYLAQSNFVGELKKVAMQYQVCIILVAHPRKSQPGVEAFSNDDVSGSSDITNKVDVVLSYGRNKDDDTEGILQVAKNRLYGVLRLGNENGIHLDYSKDTKRIWSVYDFKERHYGWENEPEEISEEGKSVYFQKPEVEVLEQVTFEELTDDEDLPWIPGLSE